MPTNKNSLFAICAYGVAFILAVLAKVFGEFLSALFDSPGAGFDVALGITVVSTICLAGYIFMTDTFLKFDPDPVDPDNPTDAEIKKARRNFETLKFRARVLMLHILLFLLVTVLPFEEALGISFLILLVASVAELAVLSTAANKAAYDKHTSDAHAGYGKKANSLLPFLVVALVGVAIWQKYDGPGFIKAVKTRAKQHQKESASAKRRSAPDWDSALKATKKAVAQESDDPLAGEQNVVLHSGSAESASESSLDFVATINNWEGPVTFQRGYTTNLPLLKGSYINSELENSAHITIRADIARGGINLTFEDGAFQSETTCTGNWSQGSIRGTYKLEHLSAAGGHATLCYQGRRVAEIVFRKR